MRYLCESEQKRRWLMVRLHRLQIIAYRFSSLSFLLLYWVFKWVDCGLELGEGDGAHRKV